MHRNLCLGTWLFCIKSPVMFPSESCLYPDFLLVMCISPIKAFLFTPDDKLYVFVCIHRLM